MARTGPLRIDPAMALRSRIQGDLREADRTVKEIRSRDLGPARSDVEESLQAREALLAATRGGAAALGLEYVGNLAVGATADLVVLDAPSYVHLAYRPGVPLVHQVVA